MKYLKDYLLHLGILLTFSFSILAADEREEEKCEPYYIPIQQKAKAKDQFIEKEKPQAKSEAKSELLAYMSDELRTPLISLIGVLDIINQENITQEDLLYLQIAKDTSASLLSALNHILDLYKIEKNELILEAIEFNPMKVVKEVLRLLSFSAKNKNVSLKLITDGNMPNKLIGDPNRVRQILMNLVGNAIKLVEKGSVEVLLNGEQYTGSKEGSAYILSATIKDTGIGISPENLESLLQPFSQTEEFMPQRFGGTGVGLYITKYLCEFMGGKVDVKSVEAEGPRFNFKINLLLPGKPTQPKLITSLQSSTTLQDPNILTTEAAEDKDAPQLTTKLNKTDSYSMTR